MNLNTDNKLSKQQLNSIEKHLLNDFQHDFPLVSRPFKKIADEIGTSEEVVIETLKQLQNDGFVSRVGAVFRANSIGASTLAAMAIPKDELEAVAAMVNEYSEVNHNYQREHQYNLWFVLTASDEHTLNAILDDIEHRSGHDVMYLPMLEDFHIDLGFELDFDHEPDQKSAASI